MIAAHSLYDYLESTGSLHPIWLDNLIAFHKFYDIEGMQSFLSTCQDSSLYLKLYTAACRYTADHSRFYSLAKISLSTECLSSILSVLHHIVSLDHYSLDERFLRDAIILGSESFEVEVERNAVKLASVLLQKDDTWIREYVVQVVNDRPRHPNAVDYRRLCFIVQVSIETGFMREQIEALESIIAPRSRYPCIDESVPEITLQDLIDEIPLYSGRHECVHECYND